MTLSIAQGRHYLKSFKLKDLFIDGLGWDRHPTRLSVQVGEDNYTLEGIAEKRGVQIFRCKPGPDGKIPDYATRQKIEKQVTKSAYEHLIIFIDADQTIQIWQWVSRQPGQPAAYREHPYHAQHHSGDSLIQKLDAITFNINEEEGLTLTGVIFRLHDAFDRDHVTKRFYDLFKKEHKVFLDFIEGITEQGDREWYASLMLNRLMFVYFIQRKGFLDEDRDYLKNRLKMVQEQKGKGKFLSFYRYFLIRLFHEGFSQQPAQRAADLEKLLGKIPYLNGGLFELHELEQRHSEIDIPDEAFERLFDFFDQYEWTLDTRPLRNDREINPDVLGYIFEKFINQKQMGAYYTKEDITEYISKNTIIPYLFDAAEKKCAIAFQTDSALWQLLSTDPDRYIYPAVRKGVIDAGGHVIPLPAEIEKGISSVKDRGNWNSPADPEYALPTEIWREHVARRQRCLEVRGKLSNGEIHEINDLITYNLDIRQFAQDVITNCEGPELLRAFYKAISSVTILDPTCGSGAFLFAALNILESLYEACLDRMQAFLEDLERSAERHRPEKFSDFRRTLAEIEKHPNLPYFIFKSIIVNNLYGVDIMQEAVEICKLRLFLKLVAQVDKVKHLEPLPDIDFNIRAGNTLVGFASLDDIKRTIEEKLPFNKGQVNRIVEEAEIIERAFQRFHKMQVDQDMNAAEFSMAKGELRHRLDKLTTELDQYMATEYGIDPEEQDEHNLWCESHQPFHWVAEFFGIMQGGGFDVALGNPPYIVYSPSKVEYRIEPLRYKTLTTKNLYAFVFERCIRIVKKISPVGLIVQLTVLSSGRLPPLQDFLIERGSLYALPFPRRPQSMFDGVEMPVAILLSVPNISRKWMTSRVGRIYTEERPKSLQITNLIPHDIRIDGCRVAKLGSSLEVELFNKIESQKQKIGTLTVKNSGSFVYYQEACRYWLKAQTGNPHFVRNGELIAPPHGRFISFKSERAAQFIGCLLNSSLFYWYYSLFSDCEHVNDQLVRGMRIPGHWEKMAWERLSSEIDRTLRKNAVIKTIMTKQGHKIEYKEMNAALSKKEIDKVDVLLGDCYGFTENETDFIINYDIKYRSGVGQKK